MIIKNNKSIDEEWASIKPRGIIKFADELFTYQFKWQTFFWYHICLLHSPSSQIRLIINKKNIEVSKLASIRTSSTKLGMNAFDSVLLGYNSYGQFRDLHIWSRELNDDSILKFQGCNRIRGDVFSWEKWKFPEDQSHMLGHMNTCSDARYGLTDLLASKRLSLTDATIFCGELGGELYYPSSEQDFQEVMTQLRDQNNEGCNFRAYLGLRKGTKSGEIYNPRAEASSKMAGLWSRLWHPLAPNGGDHQTCVAVNLTNHYLDDVSCHSKLCSLCNYKTAPVFSTRGLCEKEDFIKWKFKMSFHHSSGGGRYIFSGFGPTILIFNDTFETFNVIDVLTRQTLAWRRMSIGYPFGRGPWQLMESPCLESGEEKTVILDMSR